MKINYLKMSAFAVIAASTLFLGSCSKDDNSEGDGGSASEAITVPKVNTSLLVKHTGTRCPPCGGWGWTAFEDMMAASSGKAVFVQAYDQNFVSELFITPTAEDWKKPLGLNSWPSFIGNFVLQTARSGNNIDVAQTKANMANVANNHAAAPVVGNSVYKTTVSDNKVNFDLTTRFFEPVDVDCHLAVYVVEDKVVGSQSGHPQTPNVSHHYVLRQVGPSFGASLNNGIAPEVGKNINSTATVTLDPSWNKSNLYSFTVIWKKVGNSYAFMNATPAKKLFP